MGQPQNSGLLTVFCNPERSEGSLPAKLIPKSYTLQKALLVDDTCTSVVPSVLSRNILYGNRDLSLRSGLESLFQSSIYKLAAQICRLHFYVLDGCRRNLEDVV